MNTNQIIKQETRDKIEKDLRRRITEGYFIHCKIEKPDFKTAEEGQNWYDQQNWIAEKIVGSWVDETMSVVDQAINEAVEETRKEAFEISDQAILRMQIMAVEACGRLKEDEGVKIVNDIRGKYEQLKEDLDKLTK